jgi:hypothetical protein
MRPLFIVEKNSLKLQKHHIDRYLTFDELKKEGVL